MSITVVCGLRRRLARWGLANVLVLALVLGSALAAMAQEQTLASQAIAVWPEYDQPAVLVILDAVFQEEVALPQPVTVTIPPEAEVHAVAYRDISGILRSLPWEVSPGEAGQTLAFQAPEREFVVEYYADLLSSPPARSFELAIALPYASQDTQLSLRQPSRAGDLTVTPAMEPAGLDELGNPLYTLALGPTTAGQVVPVAVAYNKQDDLPSVEAAAAPVPATPGLQESTDAGGPPDWLLILVGLLGGALVGGVALWALNRYRLRQATATRQQRRWQERQSGREGTPRSDYCTQCGHKYGPGDQFCRQCGSRRA